MHTCKYDCVLVPRGFSVWHKSIWKNVLCLTNIVSLSFYLTGWCKKNIIHHIINNECHSLLTDCYYKYSVTGLYLGKWTFVYIFQKMSSISNVLESFLCHICLFLAHLRILGYFSVRILWNNMYCENYLFKLCFFLLLLFFFIDKIMERIHGIAKQTMLCLKHFSFVKDQISLFYRLVWLVAMLSVQFEGKWLSDNLT